MLDFSLFKKGSCVAVALSGGKDSVCLLHLLKKNAEKLGVNVKAINVEHGIRGESSVKDTEFARDLCQKSGVQIKIYNVDAPERSKAKGESLEQAARALRYECFLNAISSGFCDCVATAHHLSDNAETVLLNVLRGSSLKGLCGINKTALNGKIIRPLLYCPKTKIDDYVRENGLTFVTDETNLSNDYSRNYLRNEIIPLIIKKFPQFEKSVARAGESLREDDKTLDRLAEKLICENSVTIPVPFEKSIFCRACIIVFKKLGFTADYTAEHLNALCNLTLLQTGARVNLKNGITAYKEREKIIFTQSEQKSGPISPLSALSDKSLDFGDYRISLGKTDISGTEFLKNAKNFYFEKCGEREELYFDLEKLPEGAVLRTRREGDEIITFGGIKKSLKKYFSDKKISSRISSGLPLVASGNEIYIVAAVDVCELLKIDKNTKIIAKLTCTKKEKADV